MVHKVRSVNVGACVCISLKSYKIGKSSDTFGHVHSTVALLAETNSQYSIELRKLVSATHHDIALLSLIRESFLLFLKCVPRFLPNSAMKLLPLACMVAASAASHINYTTVTGYFLQDDDNTNATTFDYVSHTKQSNFQLTFPDNHKFRVDQSHISQRLQ